MTSQCVPVKINSSGCSGGRVTGIVQAVEGCPVLTSADDRPIIQITDRQTVKVMLAMLLLSLMDCERIRDELERKRKRERERDCEGEREAKK